MCGVAGMFVTSRGPRVELQVLKSMISMLDHRGPDGYGIYRDDSVGLAHSRLSIIDLAGGFQPITNEDEMIWLSFNGEIFNFVELRRLLVEQGHIFKTHGDSEVIVHLYEQYGPDAWLKLNGQFAFALWDRHKHQLWLVRDRLGILPMFYAQVGPQLIFASEIKAIFASRLLSPEIDVSAAMEAFTHWSVRAPRTMFCNVKSVEPGTALCFGDGLRRREYRYWRHEFSIDPDMQLLDMEQVADQLEDILDSAVQLRLRSDVPVGAYLSGGVDSSLIGSLIRRTEGIPIETFSVRFTDPDFDETVQQRQIAKFLGTTHHEITCGEDNIRDALADVVWHCETLLVRTAPIPLFLLSSLVKQHGMKVVLTGEGADELFGGYSIFKEDSIRRFWARKPDSMMRPRLLSLVHQEVAAGNARESGLWRQFFGQHLTEVDDPFYSHRIRWENSAWTTRILASDFKSNHTTFDVDLPQAWFEWDPLSRAKWLETETFMSPYLLPSQGDRVAMANGVEVRYPFLDPAVVDWASRLPTRFNLVGLHDKLVLRRLASRHIPRELAERPKVPYRAPMMSPFFKSGNDQMVKELLSRRSCEQFGLVDSIAVGKLVDRARRRDGYLTGEREQMALIGALTLQLLAQMYLVEFDSRAREASARLEKVQPAVLVDRIANVEATRSNLTEQA